MQITNAKNAKTLSPSHMKQCILSESRFDFLKDLVKNIPDINNDENQESTSAPAPPPTTINNSIQPSGMEHKQPVPAPTHGSDHHTTTKVHHPPNLNYSANFYTEQSSSSSGGTTTTTTTTLPNSTSVIQFNRKIKPDAEQQAQPQPPPPPPPPPDVIKIIGPPTFHLGPKSSEVRSTDVPPLIPIVQQPPQHEIYNYSSNNDTLCIDEDYDN